MRKIIWAGAIFLGLLLGFLLFYRPAPLTGRRQLAAEAEMHKVKRITQKQIDAEALRLGDSLVYTADSLLHVRLTAAFASGSLSAALKNYPPQQYPEVQALAQKYGATVARTSSPLPTNSGPEARVKTASNTEILYTKPMVVNNALCLNCHGTVGQEVSAASLAKLQQTKPAFKLTGFRTGERIGSWQIKLKRQFLLENLSRRSRRSLRPE
jgi:cytochrome c553